MDSGLCRVRGSNVRVADLPGTLSASLGFEPCVAYLGWHSGAVEVRGRARAKTRIGARERVRVRGGCYLGAHSGAVEPAHVRAMRPLRSGRLPG